DAHRAGARRFAAPHLLGALSRCSAQGMSTPGRASWRDPGAIAAGVGAVAVAVWLIPASVYIVRWTANGPTRVALFAPLARLVWIGAAAAIGLVALLAWARTDANRRQRAAAVIGPFAVLWVWAVPFLPWLADRIPLLLVLAGPIRWSFVIVALAGAMGLSEC